MLSSPAFYDALSNGGLADNQHLTYRYRQAVDSLVLRAAPDQPRYLDVGSGTGERSARLAHALDASSFTMCDDSPLMAARSARFGPVLARPLEDLYYDQALHGTYDLITCLHNVLGHGRFIHFSIACFEKLLAPGGVVVFDVFNRYNLGAYGFRRVARNVLHNCVRHRQHNGYLPHVEGGNETLVKYHTRAEVEALDFGGLKLVCRKYLDAQTGESRASQWRGHLVYVLRKRLSPSVGGPGTSAGRCPPRS